MEGLRHLLSRITSPEALWIALWVGLGVFTLVLIALLHTRLGKSKPLQKCTVLAVWFHLLLLIYATSIQIVQQRPGGGNQVTINLSSGGTGPITQANDQPAAAPKPQFSPAASWAVPDVAAMLQSAAPRARIAAAGDTSSAPRAVTKPLPTTASPLDVPAPLAAGANPKAPKPAAAMKTPARPDVPRAETRSASQPPTTKPTAEKPQLDKVAKTKPPATLKESASDQLPHVAAPAELADFPDPLAAIAATPAATVPSPPSAQLQNGPAGMTRIPQPDDVTSVTRPAPEAPAVGGAARLLPIVPATAAPEPRTEHHPPQLYQQRVAADREQVAAAHGGSNKTEAAVNASLKWLATHQEADGRWSPRRFGGGQESEVLGHNRGGAGAQADTGITGLALLAMLGAGHTQERGDYQTPVGNGLQYLLDIQHPNGNLGGNAEPFAFMYCHGMATLALSEALAMTGDRRLEDPVRRAIGYTRSAQNTVTGGWRYRPMESGDLSQLGWQLMALKSAELAGIDIPQPTRDGMQRFLQGASSGAHGGLASYRAGERVSRPMTAEALVCKQFLGLPRQNPAGDEAGNFLLAELPGQGERNYYYWYYGTLGMYQLQGEHWRRWNDALTAELLRSQTTTGDFAGTWEPNDVWGGYGGRVYSTALATLCLEVYYRYLPLYVEAASNGAETLRK